MGSLPKSTDNAGAQCPWGCPKTFDRRSTMGRHIADVHLEQAVFYPVLRLSSVSLEECLKCGWWRAPTDGNRHDDSTLCDRRARRQATERRAKANSEALQSLSLYGEELRRETSFVYLGRTFTEKDTDQEALERNLSKARRSWFAAAAVFRSWRVGRARKVRLMEAVVNAPLLYACESWAMTESMCGLLRCFQQRCLRCITGLQPVMVGDRPRYPAREEVLKKAGVEDVVTVVRRRRLRFFGAVARSTPRLPVQRVVGAVWGKTSLRAWGEGNHPDWLAQVRADLADAGLETREAASASHWDSVLRGWKPWRGSQTRGRTA